MISVFGKTQLLRGGNWPLVAKAEEVLASHLNIEPESVHRLLHEKSGYLFGDEGR